MLFLPDLIPKTLEELARGKDEDEKLAREEAEWNAKLQAIRDYKRNTTPMGLPPKTPQEEEGADDEDEEMTEEEEEEEEEEDEPIEEAEIDEEGESEDLEFEQ